jgi:hypothetical protein
MGVSKILAIAITEYDNKKLNEIENCEGDLGEILKILSNKYVFDDIRFIYKREDTTRKNLYALLNEYFINSDVGDNILLLYAGHGNYNNQLGISYWQPSDADPTDPSGWININDLLAFIKAAQALHVGIISDSCFSGAIFESGKRGGGIEAFTSKKSREALTSGGVEAVSDGQKGDKSPFTKTLTKLLMENEKVEMPFSLFATNVVLQFEKSKAQTPRFGSLADVGHEGGSFVFELARRQIVQNKIDDPDNFLQAEMGNMYIAIPENAQTLVDELGSIRGKKIELVKTQKFEEAVELRDIEKALFEKTVAVFVENLESFTIKIEYSENDIKRSEQLDADVNTYIRNMETQKVVFERERVAEENRRFSIPQSEQEVGLPQEIFQIPLQITLQEFAALFSSTVEPSDKLFRENQEALISAYKKNVLELLVSFKRIQAKSKNPNFLKIESELMEILIRICKYEIRILTGSLSGYIDKSILKGELELSMLNWIRKKS